MEWPRSLSKRIASVRDQCTSWAWVPSIRLARYAVLSILTRIEVGELRIVDENGEVITCGDGRGGAAPGTTLRVSNGAFWIRVMLSADMGFAESYMLGEVTCADLTTFFKLFVWNREQLANGSTVTSTWSNAFTTLARRSNTLVTSRVNTSAHYDISNDMFAAFLSPDMTYSCPIWAPRASAASATETLEEAQRRKLSRMIELARLKPTDRVLEIGTGWGSFAIAAVRASGCAVTSLTLSIEQKALAEERVAAAGLADRIDVRFCDYRAMQVPPEGPFDKLVSIEMIEAVGREWLETYFQCVDRLLKRDGGIAVFQCITMPETRYEAYAASTDFIRRYIFPGGHLPTVTQLVASLAAGAKGSLILENLENIGGHYAKTLRVWGEEFSRRFDDTIAPALMKDHDGMTRRDVEVFRRKWEYYFAYCEAGFATKTLGDVIFAAGREGTVEMLEEIPL